MCQKFGCFGFVGAPKFVLNKVVITQCYLGRQQMTPPTNIIVFIIYPHYTCSISPFLYPLHTIYLLLPILNYWLYTVYIYTCPNTCALYHHKKKKNGRPASPVDCIDGIPMIKMIMFPLKNSNIPFTSLTLLAYPLVK